jgi:hypothetical protein
MLAGGLTAETAGSRAVVLAVSGKAKTQTGTLERYAVLRPDERLVVSASAAVTVLLDGHKMTLRGPAEGALRTLVAAASPAKTLTAEGPASSLVTAARVMADWLATGTDATAVASVRTGGVVGPLDPPPLLPPSLTTAALPFVAPGERLPEDIERELEAELSAATALASDGGDRAIALLRAALLAQYRCYSQAEAELQRAAVNPNAFWRHLALDVRAQWRDAPGSAWRSLEEATVVPTGGQVRLVPRLSRGAHLVLLLRQPSGAWDVAFRAVPETLTASVVDGALTLRVVAPPGRESLALIASLEPLTDLPDAGVSDEWLDQFTMRAAPGSRVQESLRGQGYGAALVRTGFEHR